MSALPDQISDDPVFLTLLNPTQFEGEQLAAPRPTAQERGQHRVIAERARRGWGRGERQQPAPLLRPEPVAQADAQFLSPFYSTDSSGQLRAEQSGIGRLIREPTDRREPPIDGA